MKRRDVIKTAGLALLGSVVAPIDSYSASTKSLNNAFNSDELNGVSNKRKLGMNLEVSSIGLGVQNMSRTYQTTIPSRTEMINIITTAYDKGVTLFDAAEE